MSNSNSTLEEETDRGLECFTGYRESRRNINRAIDTVLREQFKQTRQRQGTISSVATKTAAAVPPPRLLDYESIAHLYREATKECQLNAVYRALLDERLATEQDEEEELQRQQQQRFSICGPINAYPTRVV